jgi:two-component sensor histidine kinase
LTGVVIAGALALVRYTWRRLAAPDASQGVPFTLVVTVHLFWLCAAPVILHLGHLALAPSATRRDRVTLGVFVALTLAGEPLWAWMVMERAHYVAYLRATIGGRTDLNAMVVVLLLGLELTELRVDAAREQLARHAQLLRSVAEAQLAALTLHLQPHFLFNTLQLVAEFARTDAEQAAQVVRALRRLFAESARHTTRRVVSAAEEIDFIRAYLSIQLTRFEERLRVEIDVDPRAADAAVPHMLLQPIVENAIQHGIGGRAKGGTISVIVRVIEDGKRLLVLVRDDGPGPAGAHRARAHLGRGMSNTRARLAAMYGDDFVFGLRQIGHLGAEARIDIPLREVRALPDGERQSEDVSIETPLPHRTWRWRLALAWTLMLLVQPLVLMLVWGEELGRPGGPTWLLLSSQLREIPFYLLAFAAAELVERLRRDAAQGSWLVGLHVATALGVIWVHQAARPLIDMLLGPDQGMESPLPLFGLRLALIYGATVAFARAHMLTHWAAARSSVVQDVDRALLEAERDVCRAQVHQPAVLATLRALEASCQLGAEAVDARAQSLAKLLRLCLDALDDPLHDVEAELRIANAYCAVFGLDGTVSGITDDATLHAILPPGTLATAIASLGAVPAERPLVDGGIVEARLEMRVAFRTSGVVDEPMALERTLSGAVRGGALVRRRLGGPDATVDLSLPLLRHSDLTPDLASDVLLSA